MCGTDQSHPWIFKRLLCGWRRNRVLPILPSQLDFSALHPQSQSQSHYELTGLGTACACVIIGWLGRRGVFKVCLNDYCMSHVARRYAEIRFGRGVDLESVLSSCGQQSDVVQHSNKCSRPDSEEAKLKGSWRFREAIVCRYHAPWDKAFHKHWRCWHAGDEFLGLEQIISWTRPTSPERSRHVICPTITAPRYPASRDLRWPRS